MNTNEELINFLIKDGYLKSPLIIDAFKKIDRGDFVTQEDRGMAYENTALSIRKKQTISQPLVVAFMLELLEPKAGEKILEIGTGSGWNTALLARLADKPQTGADDVQIGAGKLIFSIERIPELHEFAKNNLKKYPSEFANILLALGDGSRGYDAGAPYDRIIAAASAEEIPQVWKDQLKIGGRIVAPVKNSILVMDKITKDDFETKEYFGFSFVPLVVD